MAFAPRRTASLAQSYSRAVEQPTPIIPQQKKTGKVDRGIQYRRDLIRRLARYPTPPPVVEEEPAHIAYHDDHEEDFSGSVQVSESPLLRFSSMNTISDDIPLLEPVITHIVEPKPQRVTGKAFREIDYQRELLRKLSRVATPRKQKPAYESDMAQHYPQQMSAPFEDHIISQQTVENIAVEEKMHLEPAVQNTHEQPHTTFDNITTTFEDFITPSENIISTAEDCVTAPKELITSSDNITTTKDFVTTANPLPVINTAVLTTAAEDIRQIQLQAGIEDTTFDEFESILEDPQPSSPEAAENTDADDTLAFLTYDHMGRPLSKEERERRLDQLFLQRMSDRLTKTSTNIRQAKQGIERLEREVSSSSTPTPATAAIHEFTSPVEPDLYIKIRVPRLWTHTGSATPAKGRNVYFDRNWKFTWCGLILFLFSIWFITETAVCSAYCKPEYASEAVWSYNDPSFPYAIPTKVDHLTGKSISTAIDGVSSYIGNIISPSRPVHRSRSSAPAIVTWEDRIGRFEEDELVWE